MRFLRNVIIGIAVFTAIVSFSGLVFAKMGYCGRSAGKTDKQDYDVKIKVLRNSAAALQASNPDLAKGLNNLADKKEEMMQSWQEWRNRHDAKIKLLKDSAAALKASNPDLARELRIMSKKEYDGKGYAGAKMGCSE